jgi:hypothetical protein
MFYKTQLPAGYIIAGSDRNAAGAKITDHCTHFVQDGDGNRIDPAGLCLKMDSEDARKKNKKKFLVHGSSF